MPTTMTVKKIFSMLLISALLSSCGEEVLTQNTLSETFGAPDLETFQHNTCAAMRFVKPPVDILFVVDNSGSTLQSSFEKIKGQIANTASTISNEFDYHIYIAPLNSVGDEGISSYPLIVSDVNSLQAPYSNYNLIDLNNISSQTFFSEAAGGNKEKGFQRVYDLLNGNRSNGIFRNDSHTIAVMISNGDDEEVTPSSGTNTYFDAQIYSDKKSQLLNLSNAMDSESFRFISLAPHTDCSGWKKSVYYKKMSADIYDAGSFNDDNSLKNSRDLCSGNYAKLFSVVNNSIRQDIVGHKYDHWKISSASETEIQTNDITVTKIDANGNKTNIPAGGAGTNGFEFLGHTDSFNGGNPINTRYEPDPGEPVEGLIIRLHGNARVEYDEVSNKPECIVAKTRTPTEYFGYAVLPREPQVETIKVEINGQDVPSSSLNGWSYEGHKPSTNIKVPGPENTSVQPGLYKSGYFIKMNGSAVFTNGDTINIYYKPKAI